MLKIEIEDVVYCITCGEKLTYYMGTFMKRTSTCSYVTYRCNQVDLLKMNRHKKLKKLNNDACIEGSECESATKVLRREKIKKLETNEQ